MSEARRRARELLVEVTAGPLQVVNGTDVRVAAGMNQYFRIASTQREEDAALFAETPTLLATVCDEGDALDLRVEQAEAQAAAMREALKLECDARYVNAVCNQHAEFSVVGKSGGAEANACEAHAQALMESEGGVRVVRYDTVTSRALSGNAGRALLDRLHAAETRVADLEGVCEEQAAKLRRHLDELRTASLSIEDLESKNARLEDAEAERDTLRAERDALHAALAMDSWDSCTEEHCLVRNGRQGHSPSCLIARTQRAALALKNP